jgi:hypothetical protein
MTRLPIALGLLVVCFCAFACSATGKDDRGGASSGSGGASSGGSGGTIDPGGQYTDFPAPLVDPAVPGNTPSLFGPPESGAPSGGPCLIEPEPGTLYPRNWLRPRFTWLGGGNIFELRLHVDNQTNDLVVYTSASTWTMPQPLWDALRAHSADVPMTISLRSGVLSAGGISDIALGSSGPLGVAPIEAPGSIVFWSINSKNDTSLLKGFSVGEEGIADVLNSNQLPAYGSGGRQCIGCHTGSPDGQFVGVSWVTDDGYAVDFASIDKGSAPGPAPTFVSDLAKQTMALQMRTTTSFSKAHWAPGDRIMLTTLDSDLAWIDLEAQNPSAVTGILARSGDPNPEGLAPSWSHDGQNIVYMSGPVAGDPFEEARPLDLFVIPYNGRAGATGGAAVAMPVPGASDPNVTEYYPAYSPDDQWIAYNAMGGAQVVYDNPNAELFVVPASGGQPVWLEANAPPACSGKTSPGVTNSWPKWSPEVSTSNGRKYYWIVFSSRRASAQPKLFIAPMMVDGNGAITTYKALYLWNQDQIPDGDAWGNHTPAWESFTIPPAMPR